jgi:hypothetical protein
VRAYLITNDIHVFILNGKAAAVELKLDRYRKDAVNSKSAAVELKLDRYKASQRPVYTGPPPPSGGTQSII